MHFLGCLIDSFLSPCIPLTFNQIKRSALQFVWLSAFLNCIILEFHAFHCRFFRQFWRVWITMLNTWILHIVIIMRRWFLLPYHWQLAENFVFKFRHLTREGILKGIYLLKNLLVNIITYKCFDALTTVAFTLLIRSWLIVLRGLGRLVDTFDLRLNTRRYVALNNQFIWTARRNCLVERAYSHWYLIFIINIFTLARSWFLHLYLLFSYLAIVDSI